MVSAPHCPYCGRGAALVTGDVIYPHRPDLAALKFWQCAPCDAYVGCHRPGAVIGRVLGKEVLSDGTAPLGRLADEALRTAKGRAHRVFDPLWKQGQMSRRGAYAWLAGELRIDIDQCHIGMFDLAQCAQVIDAVARRRLR